MKFLKFKYLMPQLFVLLLLVSCGESDNVVDQITDEVTRGAVLRQIEVFSNSFALNTADNTLNDGENFSVLLEYQDNENGDLLQQVDVFLGYIDNTDDNGDNNVSEVFVESIDASEFSQGDRGLPQTTYTITAQEAQSQLGLANAQLGTGGDQFTVRFEILLTDGRSFSNDDNSGTITGSYFNSPFLNRVTVVCAPSRPTAGDWVFEMTDAWGDGWNGGSLDVSLDGGAPTSLTNSTEAADQPASTTDVVNFNVPDGTETISIMYSPGAFDCEVTYRITSANGNVVGVGGPTPAAGVEILDYCPDNL